MSQDNQFYQYGYDHYLKAPKKPSATAASAGRSGVRGPLMRKLRSPAVATVALLSAGALFAGVIFVTYPSDDNAKQPIPIVKADIAPIKEAPIERGGMDIPQRESTILAQVGQPSVEVERGDVENLLAKTPEELMNKEKALEEAMRFNPMMPEEDRLASDQSRSSVEQGDDFIAQSSSLSDTSGQAAAAVDRFNATERAELKEPKPLLDPVELSSGEPEEVAAMDAPSLDDAPKPMLKEPDAGNILQKIGSANSDDKEVGEFAKMTSKAALVRKPLGHVTVASKTATRPAQMHAAAQSPETLEFVRSVLNSQDESVSDIEPASGTASVSSQVQKQAVSAKPAPVAAGDYFVQLASITDAARAGTEWSKMKAKYTSLSASSFRVQEANLSSGTFYRIQAGPMSKESAERICDSLKNAGKPGGCLVVK